MVINPKSVIDQAGIAQADIAQAGIGQAVIGLNLFKKGAVRRLFLCAVCIVVLIAALSDASFAAAANQQVACPTPAIDAQASIRYIHDGDTINLKDGRKVRLIGINTPELARDNKPAEPYAKAAKQALQALFRKDPSIALVYGKDKRDRYGRLLAHAYTGDGKNVQQVLLARGMASAIAIPPNTRFSACYLAAETTARCQHRGIWRHRTVLEAKNLKPAHSGFHLVKGRVKRIDNNAKGIWLNLDDRLTVGIRPADRALFDQKMIDRLQNQSIVVRGWLNHSKRKNPFYLRVRHPAAIQLADELACARSTAAN